LNGGSDVGITLGDLDGGIARNCGHIHAIDLKYIVLDSIGAASATSTIGFLREVSKGPRGCREITYDVGLNVVQKPQDMSTGRREESRLVE
jgi:hypothetical protein